MTVGRGGHQEQCSVCGQVEHSSRLVRGDVEVRGYRVPLAFCPECALEVRDNEAAIAALAERVAEAVTRAQAERGMLF